MGNLEISLQGLSRSFGDNKVLENIDMHLDGGVCYALLGNNGAGKSTLINLMADLLKPGRGIVKIAGMTYPDDAIAIKHLMGILPQKNTLNDELSAFNHLWFVGLLYGIPADELEERIGSLASYLFTNKDDIHQRCGSLSFGMKKRVGLMAALLNKPAVLLLDEPFAGLDPFISHRVVSLLNSYRRPDRIIFISSHNLHFMEQVANRIGVLHLSELVFEGSMDELKAKGEDFLQRTLFELLQEEEKNQEHLKWLTD